MTPDIVLGPYEGSEPGNVAPKLTPADHKHVWDFVPSHYGDPPKFEQCLLCKERRRIPKPEPQTYIPQPACKRTGY